MTRSTARWRRVVRGPWSPYAAGALLGVVSAASLALFERPLGASAAFEELAGYAGRRLAPGGVYFGFVTPPGFTWRSWLMVGVFLGALLASASAGTLRLRWLPEQGWVETFGPRVATRWVLAFAGAALVEFGAGIAGGCTSGLAISGGVVLAPAAFVFMAAMFAGGIPVAFALARRARALSRGAPAASSDASGLATPPALHRDLDPGGPS